MHHTSVFNASAAAAGATNTDFTFATEPVLRGQNNHLILTAAMKLLGVSIIGASVTRGRWQIPKWNFYGEPTLFTVNRSLQVPANPQWDYWAENGPLMPLNQEIQLQVSNNLGAATEIENGVVMLAPPSWNKQIPEQPLFTFWTRATVAITPTLNAWSGGANISLAQSLLGGTYGIRRAVIQGTNAVAARLVLARPLVYGGYPLRPGDLVQTAVGDALGAVVLPWQAPWGRWGYFSTLELPQLEVFGTVAGAITYQIFMELDYLTDDVGAIDNYVRSYSSL